MGLTKNGNDTIPWKNNKGLVRQRVPLSNPSRKVSGGQHPSTGTQNRHRNGITTE